MARIKDSSVETVKAVADIVALVEGYTRLRKSGARYVGLCPFHRERTPSFGVTPDRGTFKCFGCGEGGDAITFVERKENLDFVGAIEWLADRFGVQLEYEETSPEQDRLRKRRERLFQLLDRAATFYERYLWESEAGSLRPRLPRLARARRGDLSRVPARARARRLGAHPRGGRAGLHARGARRCRADQPARQRLLQPASALPARRRPGPRARLSGPSALRRRPAAREVRQLARGGSLPQGRPALRARPRPRQRSRRHDQAVIVEGNTDVIALRQAGFEPVVAAMGTALTEAQLRELNRLTQAALALLRRRRSRPGGDAARDGARRCPGVRHTRRVAARRAPTRPTTRPRSRLGSPAPRTTCRTACASRSSGPLPDRQRAFERVREVLAPFPESPERQDAVRLAADRLGLPVELQAGLAPAARSRTGAVSTKVLEAGVRQERNALAGVVAHTRAETAPRRADP